MAETYIDRDRTDRTSHSQQLAHPNYHATEKYVMVMTCVIASMTLTIHIMPTSSVFVSLVRYEP